MSQDQKTQEQPQQRGDGTVLEEAKNLLVQGKRFMAMEDYQSATDYLEQSCQLFDAYYGVAKRECADAYLEYGLALVALANLEAGSSNDIFKKVENQEEEDDDDEEQDDEEGADDEESEVKEAQEGENDKGEGVNDIKKANGKAENGESETNTDIAMDQTVSQEKNERNGINGNIKHDPQPSSSEIQQTEPVPGTSNCTGGDQDGESVDNEEATTIEIAWEVLCLAKRLFMTDESLEGRLKLAETLHKIGEISIEWENNDNAVSILEECLKIRTAILKPDDRLIALTYYHLGLAHSFKSDTQNANLNFQNAINVIEKRVASLSEEHEKAKANQDTVAIGAYQKEINELKDLIPEMNMRIDDSKEDGTKSTEVLKRTREEMQQEDEEAKKVCSDKSKPADDISHLVKRKAT